MPVHIPDFWKAALESRLFSPAQRNQLDGQFALVKGAVSQGNARTLAEWLVSRGVLSRYQATLLLAGRAGPFHFGEYQIHDRIEQGPFAGRFQATHTPTGHPVCLQFLTGPDASEPLRWAKLAARVQAHCQVIDPHVIACHEIVDVVTYKFLVHEDPRGQSIRHLLTLRSPLTVAEACRIARQTALGLAQLHKKGLILGDLSPDTLWLEPDGNVKVLRDPIKAPSPVKLAVSDSADQLAARADTMAPELANKGKAPDVLTDIYALGGTLYQLLTGGPPFAGGNAAEKLARHAAEAIGPLENIEGISPELSRLVAYMMAKKPSIRLQQASVVAEQLAPFADAVPLKPRPKPTPTTLAAYESHIKRRQAEMIPTHPADEQSPDTMPVIVSRFSGEPSFGAGDNGRSISSSTSTAAVDGRSIESAGSTMRRRAGPQLSLLLGSCAAVVMLVAGLVIGWNISDWSGSKPSERAGLTRGKRNSGAEQAADSGKHALSPDSSTSKPPSDQGEAGRQQPQFLEIDDDGQTLWASPTWGQPIQLEYVPPGGQIFLIVRPADLLASGAGGAVLKSLGPVFAKLRQSWEAAAGVKLDEIEQLIIVLFSNDGKMPMASLVVRLHEQIDLQARWGNPQEVGEPGSGRFRVHGWDRYVPPQEEGRIFVMGSPEQIEQAVQGQGDPPVLRSDIQWLLARSDDQRHFTVLFSPANLYGDSQKLFSGNYRKLLQPIEWLLGDDLKAVMASMHFGEGFYTELRLYSHLDKDIGTLIEEFDGRLQEIPSRHKKYVLAIDPPPYWRQLWFNYPSMVRFLLQHTRIGSEERQIVINSVLPDYAAANLIVASELTLASSPDAMGSLPAHALGATDKTPIRASPKTIQEVLHQTLTLRIPQSSLEFAMRDLAQDVRDAHASLPTPFAIKIIGTDLELEGITRNQQIKDFVAQDAPIAQILTSLVRRANPVTTVKDPSEKDQKLIWVIGPDPADATKQIILITTRQAAAKKGYKLPPSFVLKQ